MSEEKQIIEEMASDICAIEGMECYECHLFENNCHAKKYARRAYNAGYRRQIEGEWRTARDGTHWCSECGHDATYTFDGTEICGVACPFCGAGMKGGAE